MFFTLVSVLLCVSFSTQDLNGPRAVSSLKLVLVVAKHGTKAPMYSFPSDPNSDVKKWPDGAGQITAIGKMQLFRLGELIRKLYNGYISEIYKKEQFQIEATMVERTMISGATLAAGLWPPRRHQMWHDTIYWQPIPIYPNFLDKSLLALTPSMCPRYYREQNETVRVFNERDPQYKDIFDLMTVNTGANITTCSQMYMVWEVLSSQLENNMPIPHWSKEIFPEKLLPIISRIYRMATIRNLKMTRLVNGLFLEYMMEMMALKKNNSSPDVRMYVHVGHDVTLLSLVMALGFPEPLVMPSGAALFYELHINPATSSGWEVKVLRVNNNHEGPTHPEVLELPHCPYPCDYNLFHKNSARFIPENWSKECHDLDSPSDEPPGKQRK
ncbi:prostatic acid phosphatase-like [Macrosteles quadrilineatus]|uniref:prostatic acid phosphatase-like n=1 Tax=Macrosteles quadrilineatus TaxID=74068 RepID=UPI0023E0AC56|nr:prostatic acid phosphatase-like [Macrosteles quadrilineatus]